MDELFAFDVALNHLKDGKMVQRVGWNGKGMWIKLISGSLWSVVVNIIPAYEKCPFIGMKTADDKFVPWLASQTDILAEDWQVVEG